MRATWIKLFAVVAILALALAACSSDDKKSDSSDKSTTTTTKAEATPEASATPTTDLATGAVVTVTVKNFKSGLTLGINECASTNESEVGQDDCDLGGIKTITVGADGTGTGTTTPTAGPIGKNAHMCTAAGTRCFLSVGELTAEPDAQRAEDIDITFAG